MKRIIDFYISGLKNKPADVKIYYSFHFEPIKIEPLFPG
jgi:hypothetical protein